MVQFDTNVKNRPTEISAMRFARKSIVSLVSATPQGTICQGSANDISLYIFLTYGPGVCTTYLYLKIEYNNTINRKRICKAKQIWVKRIFEIRIEALRADRKWSCATYYASGFTVKNIQINIHRISTCYFTLTYLSVPSTG